MTYDRLDWHLDSAIEAGQPTENAFAHIGLYLGWLIRHDMHEPELFSPSRVAAVKRGEMTGTDLSDEIDGKLVGDLMTEEGQAFSDARYDAYTAAYEATFSDELPYSVVDDAASFARMSPIIDGLYAEWVAGGRPAAAPPTPQPRILASERPMPDQFSMRLMQESMDRIAAELKPAAPTPPRPHVAPELEALIRADLTEPPPDVSSVTADRWGSPLLKRALERLEIRPADVRVAAAIGGHGPTTLAMTLYAVPGVAADRLLVEFSILIALPIGGRWGSRLVADRAVQWASGDEFTVAFWARDELVVHVAGRANLVKAAIPKLP